MRNKKETFSSELVSVSNKIILYFTDSLTNILYSDFDRYKFSWYDIFNKSVSGFFISQFTTDDCRGKKKHQTFWEIIFFKSSGYGFSIFPHYHWYSKKNCDSWIFKNRMHLFHDVWIYQPFLPIWDGWHLNVLGHQCQARQSSAHTQTNCTATVCISTCLTIIHIENVRNFTKKLPVY